MAIPRTSALVPAAGAGERLGARTSKAFVTLLGQPLIVHTVAALRASPHIQELILLLPEAEVERGRRLLASACEKVVTGGATRQDSVWRGLQQVSLASELVLVHDGARPFVTPELIERTLEAAQASSAAVAALPAAETVKWSEEGRAVSRTLPREKVWLAQTPQAFRVKLLREAHEAAQRAGYGETDDAALVERLGHQVALVQGLPENIKITYPADLRRAEETMRVRASVADKREGPRVGVGYDTHPLVEGRPLLLGGVHFPGPRGLAGHSDGDALCHAIADALLGAAGLGDIGQRFPDTDPQWAGARGVDLLARVAEAVQEAGYRIINIDAVVMAEEPKLLPFVREIQANLSQALEVEPTRISVKGKRGEGLGFVGRREGIAVQAVCTLVPV